MSETSGGEGNAHANMWIVDTVAPARLLGEEHGLSIGRILLWRYDLLQGITVLRSTQVGLGKGCLHRAGKSSFSGPIKSDRGQVAPIASHLNVSDRSRRAGVWL